MTLYILFSSMVVFVMSCLCMILPFRTYDLKIWSIFIIFILFLILSMSVYILYSVAFLHMYYEVLDNHLRLLHFILVQDVFRWNIWQISLLVTIEIPTLVFLLKHFFYKKYIDLFTLAVFASIWIFICIYHSWQELCISLDMFDKLMSDLNNQLATAPAPAPYPEPDKEQYVHDYSIKQSCHNDGDDSSIPRETLPLVFYECPYVFVPNVHETSETTFPVEGFSLNLTEDSFHVVSVSEDSLSRRLTTYKTVNA